MFSSSSTLKPLNFLLKPWLIFTYSWFVIPLLSHSSCFTLTHFPPLFGVLTTPVYPSCEASASQLMAGPSQKDFPLGHESVTLNSNTYWESPSTLWTSWTASMNDNVSAVSPLALRIETWTFHSSNRVMLCFLLRLPWNPWNFLLKPWLIFAYSWFIIWLLSYSSHFTMTHPCWLMVLPCTI